METILTAAREKEKREQKFLAAIQGIDLDKGQEEDSKERFEAVQRRIRARSEGKTEEQLVFEDMGIDME